MPPSTPHPRFGPYQITASIGAGGMGEVYRARDPRLDREVAVKVLPRDLARDAERLRRFEQEARTLAALNHPNVLTVHDAGVHEGAPYLVSELLEGRTLRDEMNGGALPVGKATDYALQTARGLAAAHGKGIVHRDLKPENIFVTKDGRVKILDFGLAKLRVADPAADLEATTITGVSTLPGRLLGTPAYMAPEQVRGEMLDHRADLFALGTVLAELFGGRHPFRRGNAIETMSAILREEPNLALDQLGGAAAALSRIILRCLEKEPGRRFQSAQDLAFAIENATTNHSVPTPAIARPPLAVAGRIQALAVKPLDDFSGDASQAYLSDAMTEALCTALGNISALRVPGRSSVMRYKGGHKGIREMAGELDVDAIIEGSVQRAGTRLLVTVKLIEAAGDRQLWSTRMERDLGEFFQLQAEVARAIATEIQVRLTPADHARLAHAGPADPVALEAWMLGMHHWWKWSAEGCRSAEKYFLQCVEADPTWAPGHAGQALLYALGSAQPGVWHAQEAMPKAKAAVQRALALDPALAEAFVARGIARYFYDWDWSGAETDYRHALQLNPNSSLALDQYNNMLVGLGRFGEAIGVLEQALKHEPLSANLQCDLGATYYYAREFRRAEPFLRRAIELDPGLFQPRIYLGWCLYFADCPALALAEFRAVVERAPGDPWPLTALGYVQAKLGAHSEARDILAQLDLIARARHVPDTARAFLCLALGERESALDWLEKLHSERSAQMTYLKVSPVLAELQTEPRFQALLEKVGLN